jgi:hypothetical protein
VEPLGSAGVTTPAPPRKPTYRTFVAERDVEATRDVVWAALVELLDAGAIGPGAAGVGRERVLSFEPPWRRSARLEVDEVGLVEHTVAIRDDGATCHMVWAFLVEQPIDPPAPAFDRLVVELEQILTASCERVATTVTGG